jgi:hypothetical protein
VIEQDDTAGRAGSAGLSPMGTGLPSARNCMPGNHNVLNQVGGGTYVWRGVRNVWHCANCKLKRVERLAVRAAA